MDELAQQVAEALGYPVAMVLRSAEARAQADGTSVEAVLAAWAGGDVPVPSSTPAPAAAPAAPAAPAEAPPAADAGPAVEVLGPSEDEPSPAEPEPEEPEAEEEPARPRLVPAWLAAAFIVLPLIAVTYALFLPNGPDCGDGAALAVDPVTGEAENCDGRPYGVEVVDFFAIGQEVYAQCSACHGTGGAGGGNFPAFINGAILATFPAGQCQSHVDWVVLGTLNWPDPTYGATETPVGSSGAQMPGFEGALTDEEIRAVVAYERIAFGGQPLPDALADCGLGEGGGELAAAG